MTIASLGQLGVQFFKTLGHPVVAVDDRKEGIDIAANEWALKILRLRGTLVVVGLPSPELDGPLTFNAFDLVFSELTIKGSLVANKQLLDGMLDVVAKHGVRSRITTLTLEGIEGLDSFCGSALRTLRIHSPYNPVIHDMEIVPNSFRRNVCVICQ